MTFIGPARTQHTDSRDDGLTLRIDYGETSAVVTGCITASGEKGISLRRGGQVRRADRRARGSEAATCTEWVEAAKPGVALVTGKTRQQRAHPAAKDRGDGLRRKGKTA